MPENYHNVKALLQELETHYFTYIIGDNKILRMIYGMQSCSATFACVWCDATSPYDKPFYTLRTFKSLKLNSQGYLKLVEVSRGEDVIWLYKSLKLPQKLQNCTRGFCNILEFFCQIA